MIRIGLATLPFPESAADALQRALDAIAEAGRREIRLLCFPEAYVPGLRCVGRAVARPDADFLAESEKRVAAAARAAKVGVILGTELLDARGLIITTTVFAPDGAILGRQEKVQIDPDEEAEYVLGEGRQLFELDGVKFGITICHEGWRYPETVRWSARRGAQIVFHPHYGEAAPGTPHPRHWADPANSFHEKAAMCRAAENTIYFATVNYSLEKPGTTSAVVAPDGTLIAHQPYGEAGILSAEIDPERATGLLARRYRADQYA